MTNYPYFYILARIHIFGIREARHFKFCVDWYRGVLAHA